MRSRPGVPLGARPGERDRLPVEDGGAAAREALDGLETLLAGGSCRVGISAARAVPLAERDHRAGASEPDRLGQLASCDALEDRSRDRGVERGAVGKACAYELNGDSEVMNRGP